MIHITQDQIGAVVAALRGVCDLLRGGAVKGDGKVYPTEEIIKLMELAQRLVEENGRAYQAYAEIVEAYNRLLEERKQEKAALRDFERYKLVDVAGTRVYALREDMARGEPPHWLCCNCHDKGIKSVFAPHDAQKRSLDAWFRCHECGFQFSVLKVVLQKFAKYA